MKLLPCPFCGSEKSYHLTAGDTYRWWLVQCNNCGRVVDECSSDRRFDINTPLPDNWPAADEAWNEAAEHAENLRRQIRKLKNEHNTNEQNKPA